MREIISSLIVTEMVCKYLPGHPCVPHTPVSRGDPEQAAPPLLACWTIVLVRKRCPPPPHDLEHVPHAPHSSQMQWTTSWELNQLGAYAHIKCIRLALCKICHEEKRVFLLYLRYPDTLDHRNLQFVKMVQNRHCRRSMHVELWF